MKKIILLFIVTITFSSSFVSCSKDDGKASLEGKWEFDKEIEVVDGNEISNDYENYCSTKKDYLEFLSSGVLNHHEFDTGCSDEVSVYTYSRNGNTITTILDGDTFTTTILKLTNSSLKIKIEDIDYPGTFHTILLNKID